MVSSIMGLLNCIYKVIKPHFLVEKNYIYSWQNFKHSDY